MAASRVSESAELTLYYTPSSFYSQKIVMALEYLNLKYEKKHINIFAGEQLEPWYLDINPKGEVPVLKDGEVLLADSADILQYLNDTYDTRRSDEKLLPNPVTPLGRQVSTLNQVVCSVKVFILTFGILFHPKHASRIALSPEEIESRKGFLSKTVQTLEAKMATAVSPYKECYNYKLTKFATGAAMLSDEDALLNEIDITKETMQKCEDQLAQSKGKWLLTDFASVVDITLMVILKRIHNLGIEHHFFSDGRMAKLKAYYERGLQESFVQQTFAY